MASRRRKWVAPTPTCRFDLTRPLDKRPRLADRDVYDRPVGKASCSRNPLAYLPCSAPRLLRPAAEPERSNGARRHGRAGLARRAWCNACDFSETEPGPDMTALTVPTIDRLRHGRPATIDPGRCTPHRGGVIAGSREQKMTARRTG